jgi:RNA polymerase-binding transcription factor DksA
MAIDTEHFKEKLLKEQQDVEAQLAKVGRKNPDNLSDWEAVPADASGGDSADENLVADSIEEYEENNAIVNTLETRLKDIRSGLDKIKHNVYGVCQICGKEIESDRLEANPAARTCKEHMSLQ